MAERLFSLEGRVAVVTGVLGLLGPVWAEGLLEAGATVLGLDLPGRTSPTFDALVGRQGEQRLVLDHADILDRQVLEAVRDRWTDRLGVPHVLVNNAGIDQPPSPGASNYALDEFPLDASGDVIRVNVLGTFQVSQVFGALMARERRGSIINIGSLYASVSPDARFYEHMPGDPPFIKPPAYGASKAAVLNLTKYFATHWGPRGVRVNALSPGGVLGNQDADFKRKFCSRVPLGRMAENSDLLGPLLFLASDASNYVTGINLQVDGGFTAW
jgi:NAD(P)-dependent dehydrogenase (short-subunit alcohol dehydrogenase family)